MNETDYRYELEESFVIIEDPQTGYSAYAELEQLLTCIEAEVGSLAGKHILCEGRDGFWDLIMPITQGKPIIYPLSAPSLADAKVKLGELLTSGLNLEIIS